MCAKFHDGRVLISSKTLMRGEMFPNNYSSSMGAKQRKYIIELIKNNINKLKQDDYVYKPIEGPVSVFDTIEELHKVFHIPKDLDLEKEYEAILAKKSKLSSDCRVIVEFIVWTTRRTPKSELYKIHPKPETPE